MKTTANEVLEPDKACANSTANALSKVVGDLQFEVARLQSEIAELKLFSLESLSLAREIRQLVGPFGVPLPDGTLLVQSIFQIKYVLDPLDMIMSPQLIIYRQWEPELSSLLSKSVNKDTIFVDVGANFGYFTCLLGSMIGNQGRGCVWAFEPNPRCFELLSTNCLINWSMSPIHLNKIGAGDAIGDVDLIVPKNRSANGSFLGKDQVVSETSFDRFLVKQRPLDSVLPDSVVVDLMKIDVEGHEWRVLAGARNTISRSQNIRIVMEWSPDQLFSAGYSAVDMADLFDKLDLEPYSGPKSLVPGDDIGVLLTRDALMSHPYDNIVLRHK